MSLSSVLVCVLILGLSTMAGGDRASAASAGDELGAALTAALSDPAEREKMRLFVECFDDGDFLSVEIFGRGIGVWNRERQFAVPPPVLVSLLTAVLDSGFLDLEPVYGGKTPRAEPPAEPPGSTAGLRLVCGVTVTLGALSKEVIQLDKGEHSPELEALAAEILRRVRDLSGSGVGAVDLGDGLAKVASGKLAPETFYLVLHRLPQQGAEGFLLRLDGRSVTTRDFHPERGYGLPRRLVLSGDEFGQRLGELAALDPGTLPVNLFSRDYTDLTVRVLNRKEEVHAQPFAGMNHEAAGERQRAFDLLVDQLYNLHLQVSADGTPVDSEG